MTLEKSQYWYVPLSELQNESGADLKLASSGVLESDRLVKEGEAFTISLESFYIKTNHETDDSGNDLLVRSWLKYGNEPTAERIHFFQKDVPNELVIENLPAEHIYSRQDHLEQNRLLLTLEITEINRGLETERAIGNTITSVASSFGAVFPAILPFAGVGSNIIDLLQKMSSANEENLQVFFGSLDLYSEASFESPLRYGAYVFFDKEVQASPFKLTNFKLQLKPQSENSETNLVPDYTVIKIIPGIVYSGDSSELLLNQQIASVLSHLENDNEGKQKHFKFLQETIQFASNMQELDYFYRLKRKQENGEELTESQAARYAEIAEKLAKYIPDISAEN